MAKIHSAHTCDHGTDHLFRRRVNTSAGIRGSSQSARGNDTSPVDFGGNVSKDIEATYSIVSLESMEGTNSLLMKSPVGTEICLAVVGTAIDTRVAMVRWWEWMKIGRERSGVPNLKAASNL